MSSPAPFDWKKLITPAAAMGGKILGDTFTPTPEQQQVQQSAQQAAFNQKMLIQKMAQANAIRRSMLPGMYTNMGYSPMDSQQMTANYSQAAPGMSAVQSNKGKIIKGILGAAMTVAPSLLGA